MADIAKSGIPSLATTLPSSDTYLALLAGVAIAAGDACYLDADGTVKLATGAAANAAAIVIGYAAKAASAGAPVTLLRNVTFHYGAGLTPGGRVYLSATTPGGLDTVATVGGTTPIGFAVDGTRIRLVPTV